MDLIAALSVAKAEAQSAKHVSSAFSTKYLICLTPFSVTDHIFNLLQPLP